MRINIERYNLSRSELQYLIDQWIFNERHRIILADRLFNGTTYERLAEKYGLSTDGYCSIKMIADWKLDFMAKLILQRLWTHRKEATDTIIEMIK